MNTQKILTALFICGLLLLYPSFDAFSQSSNERVIKVIETETGIHQEKLTTPRLRALNDTNGQVPQGFNFQALARGSDGSALANQNVSVEIKVIQGSESGTVVYTETHDITTNEAGLFQIVIGEGETSGDFSSIDWSVDNYYVGLAADPDGGTDFEELGTTRLLSVPYAFVAKNVIDGVSVGEVPITQYELNTAEGDTSFIVNAIGTDGLTALRGNASTEGFNRGVTGTANNTETNTNSAYGVSGIAPGMGTGTHIGVFGSAVNGDAVGTGWRYGMYGQALSKHRENIGGFGIGLGDGNGHIVLPGEEVNGNVGSVNAGLIGWAQGNLNYNIGVRGRAYGNTGARANVGVQATSDATANSHNIGVDVFVLNSQQLNTGLFGFVNGAPNNRGIELFVGGNSGQNTGMILNVSRNGASSIGAEIHADTSLVLHGYSFSHSGATYNGNVQVNGDLSYSGSLNNTSDRSLKENITPIQNALDVIMRLEPASYNYRGNGSLNGLPLSTGLHYGLIAQDVEQVLPALVKNNIHTYRDIKEVELPGPDTELQTIIKEMEYKSLNYVELIPMLIKAVQEQQEKIDELEKELDKLKK